MRGALVFFALSFCAATSAGQNPAVPASPTQTNPADLSIVEGTVVSSTTGEGQKKISVNLMALDGEHESHTSVTDTSGRFIFSGLAPGRYSMSAGGNGYPQQIYGRRKGRFGSSILTLAPGSHEKDLVFRLVPPGVLTGTVYDDDGNPVIGAQVQATRITRSGNRRRASSSATALTDDRGQYRIYGIQPGQYVISAMYNAQSPTAPNSDVYIPSFYPATSDPDQATLVPVAPGEEVSGIDVDLERVQGVVIRGHIVSEVPASLLRGTYVSLMPRNPLLGGFVHTNYGGPVQDDKGDFEIPGIPPGSYIAFTALNDANRA
jgi:Carboxypeptidase regulatory-like domain